MTAFQQSQSHLHQLQRSSIQQHQLPPSSSLRIRQDDEDFSCIPDTASIKSDSSSSSSSSSSCCQACCSYNNNTNPDEVNTLFPSPFPSSTERSYTKCQVRRHNHIDSAWIVANGVIYDVTLYLKKQHPGGMDCILRKAGNVGVDQNDCSKDLQFHSKRGRQIWQQYRIGTLRPCGGGTQESSSATAAVTGTKQWWNFLTR